MRLFNVLVSTVALLSSASSVSALTNGTLIPAYMCGPPTDGLPKTVGGVLPFFKLATNAGPGNQVMDGVTKIPGRPLDAPLGSVLNTQLLVAGFHSAAVQNTVITPTSNLIQLALRQVSLAGTITPLAGIPANSIVPGLDHAFSVQASPNGVFDINTALDGAIIYAQNANGVRVGQFVNTGANMQVWAACGPNSVGVVHHSLLSCTGEYPMAITDAAGNTAPAPVTAGLIWRAPAVGVGSNVGDVITFKGAGVTDLGFGPWTSLFTVVARPALPPPTPCITMVNMQNVGNSIVFFTNNQAVAGTTFAMNIIDVTQANRKVVNNQAVTAPAIFKQSALIAQAAVKAGDTISITITATNAVGSSTSAPVTAVIGVQTVVVGNAACAKPVPAATTATANSVSLALALCDHVALAEAARFGINADEDYSCAYAAAVASHVGAAAASAGVDAFLPMDTSGKLIPQEGGYQRETEFQAKSFAIGLATAIGTIGLMGAAAYAIVNKKKQTEYTLTK